MNDAAAVTGLTLIRLQFISDWSQSLTQKRSVDTVDGSIKIITVHNLTEHL